jgi:hypothetical protein
VGPIGKAVEQEDDDGIHGAEAIPRRVSEDLLALVGDRAAVAV